MDETTLLSQIKQIDDQIATLEKAKTQTLQHRAKTSKNIMMMPFLLLYFRIARFLREKVTAFLGWKWAIVFVGAIFSGAIFFVLATSVVSGAIGTILGAATLTFLVTCPSDSKIVEHQEALRELYTSLKQHRKASSNAISKIQKEIATAQDNKSQLQNKLFQLRQSQLYRLKQLAKQNWKAMRGVELEKFLETVFNELHYSVKTTATTGDQGVDLILEKDGHKIAVQVKGYLDSVPNSAIQEAYTGRKIYNCDSCAVITNSRFTSSGWDAANKVGCTLIDENKLPQLILCEIDLLQIVLTQNTTPKQAV